MTEHSIIATAAAPAAIGPYSQAIRDGDHVWCSGQVGLDPVTGEMVSGGLEAQTERVFANLLAVLEAAGGGFENVVRVTVYLTDFGGFATLNEIYARHFGDARPARATVGVSSLPKGGLVEIDCVARI